MGAFSLWKWLIVLAIVAMIFGTKRLRHIGSDLGGAIRNFRKGLEGEEEPTALDHSKPEPTSTETPAQPESSRQKDD